ARRHGRARRRAAGGANRRRRARYRRPGAASRRASALEPPERDRHAAHGGELARVDAAPRGSSRGERLALRARRTAPRDDRLRAGLLMKVVVLGGGVVGVTTAYYLARDGAEVALVEGAAELGTDATAGN